MTGDQGPVVVLDEILPLRRGSGDGPHIAVVMSLNFPDLIDPVATHELMPCNDDVIVGV